MSASSRVCRAAPDGGWRGHVAVAAAIVACAVSPTGNVRAQAPMPRTPTARAVQAEAAPIVDGRLDDAGWLATGALDGFVQREPLEGVPVSERTEVRILTDGSAL
jgi:hypothetical protein